MLCQDCSKKLSCTSLCKKAEKFVNQDYAGRRETIFHEGDVPEMFLNKEPREWPSTSSSTKELIFLMRFEDMLTQTQIADKLNVSQQYVSQVLRKIKKQVVKR